MSAVGRVIDHGVELRSPVRGSPASMTCVATTSLAALRASMVKISEPSMSRITPLALAVGVS